MRVVITGANGMIGGEAVRAAVARGHRVLAVGRGPCRLPNPRAFTYREVDLTDVAGLKKVAHSFSPEGIVHAGAMTDVDACERTPHLAWTTNFEPTWILADVAARHRARMVYVSTDSVFDGMKSEPYTELDQPRPLNVYSRSKLAGEMAVKDYVANSVIARIGPVYGGRKGGKQTFADRVIENLRANKFIGAWDQVCSPTLASACGERLVRVLEDTWTGELHCGDRTVCSRFDFAQAIAREFGLDPNFILEDELMDMNLPAIRPLNTGLSTKMCERAYPEVAPLELGEALKRYRAERGD